MTPVSEEYSLQNFQLAQPVQWKMMPQWNFHLILSALLSPPFSHGAVYRPSDDVIDQKWWTLNTTFLLLLATARRRSYLHALCVSTCLFTCGDVQNQLVVNLLPRTILLAKNQMIRLSSRYIFPASLISTRMSWRECCVGKVMWIHHLVRRCGCTCDQWTVFHST